MTAKKKAAKKKAIKVGMDAFNVTKLSNEGVKLSLMLPDGTPTEEFLVVGGADSKAFRNQVARMNRDMLKIFKRTKEQDPAEFARLTADSNRELVAALVLDWSFTEPCDKVNICKFLADAPQIQKAVDDFAGIRANFFVKPSQD